MVSSKFNQISASLLVAVAALTVGCSQQKTPEQAAEAQRLESAGVSFEKDLCTVKDRSPEKDGFFGSNNVYDYKNGVLHFLGTSTIAYAVPLKDLAEDGQARATEMFKYLAGTNCKAPKFN